MAINATPNHVRVLHAGGWYRAMRDTARSGQPRRTSVRTGGARHSWRPYPMKYTWLHIAALKGHYSCQRRNSVVPSYVSNGHQSHIQKWPTYRTHNYSLWIISNQLQLPIINYQLIYWTKLSENVVSKPVCGFSFIGNHRSIWTWIMISLMLSICIQCHPHIMCVYVVANGIRYLRGSNMMSIALCHVAIRWWFENASQFRCYHLC